MSDLDNAINSINASAAKAENTATFLDDMSTFDDQSSVTNPNNGQTVASIPKQVKDRTDELFTAAESDINQAVSDAAQSATDAQDAADSIGRYQGLWPDSGGSADKGDTYQTQVSGTPTGQYFTALQNTTVDPVGDDVNWRTVSSSKEQAHAGDSQIIGGNIWPDDSTQSALDGDDLTGYGYVRLLGGSFPFITIFKIINKNGAETPASGILSNVNLSTPPWSATVGSEDVYLVQNPYSEHEFRGYGAKSSTTTEQDAINNRNAINACLNAHPEGGEVFGHEGDDYEVMFDDLVNFKPAVHVTVDNLWINLRGSQIRMRDNDSPEYRTVYFDSTANCKISNGRVSGDREGHIIPPSTGTHEFGAAVSCRNVRNFVAEQCEAYNATGDAYQFYYQRDSFYQVARLSDGTLFQGGIDPSTGAIDLGLTGYASAYFNMTNVVEEAFHFWARSFGRNYENADTILRVFYYDDSTFLEYRDFDFFSNDQITAELPTATIPRIRLHVVDFTGAPGDAKIDLGGGYFGCNGVKVNNCDIHHSRRQGITFGGTKNSTVSNSKIHNIRGIPPQSGIDIEEAVNTNIAIDTVEFRGNAADFQNPSGLFIDIRNCNFFETDNDSSFSSVTGSVNMYNCKIDKIRAYFNGRTKLENCKISNLLMSGEASDRSYNTKTFENCMFKNVTSTSFPSIGDNYIVVDNCTIYNSSVGDVNTVHRNSTIYDSNQIPNGRYYDSEINIENTGSFFNVTGELHNTKVNQVNPATEDLSWGFISGYKIVNCPDLSFNAGSFASKINFGDVEILNSKVTIVADLSFGKNGINLTGNAKVINSEINHSGSWTASNTAPIGISGSGNVDIKRSSIVTDSVSGLSGVYILSGAPSVKLIQSSLESCTEPSGPQYTLRGNVEL